MENICVPTLEDRKIPQVENILKILVFGGFIIASFATAQLTIDLIDTYFAIRGGSPLLHSTFKWSLAIVLAMMNSFVLFGIELLVHESIHRVLFRNRFWNDTAGIALLGIFFILPFTSYRESHLKHHRYAHCPGLDPEEEMFNHSNFALTIFSGFISSSIMSRIFLKNIWLALKDGQDRLAIIADTLAIVAGGLFYFYLIPHLGISLWHTFVPTIPIVMFTFAFRNVSSHYGMPAALTKVSKPTGWVIRTHPLVEWVWSYANYHDVHHRYPYLSYCDYKQAFEATKDQESYAVVNGYIRSFCNLSRQRYHSNHEAIEPYLTVNISARA